LGGCESERNCDCEEYHEQDISSKLKDLDREEDDLIAARSRVEELEDEANALEGRGEHVRLQAVTGGARKLRDELQAL
jgi:hypothetical protein